MNTNNKKATASFILTVLLIYPLPQMAIDMYLPSWPNMVQQLHTTQSLMQASLIIYIFFLGIAQLIYGPLSDRFGRKPMLVIGLSIFILSSLCCALTHSITQILLLRALQGLGLGCGFTVASALLADHFEGPQLAKVTSYSAMIYSLSLILAPVIGSLLQHRFSWQANFIMLTLYALGLLLAICINISRQPSHHARKPAALKEAIKTYSQLIKSSSILGLTACLICAYGIIVSFNIIGPFLLQIDFDISVLQYGWLVLITGFCYFLGATLNSRLVKSFKLSQLICTGLRLLLISSTLLIIFNLCHTVLLISTIACICVSIFSIGLIYPNCFAIALSSTEHKGYVSAFIGSAILLGVALLSILLACFNQHHAWTLAMAFIVLTAMSSISYYWLFSNKPHEKAYVESNSS